MVLYLHFSSNFSQFNWFLPVSTSPTASNILLPIWFVFEFVVFYCYSFFNINLANCMSLITMTTTWIIVITLEALSSLSQRSIRPMNTLSTIAWSRFFFIYFYDSAIEDKWNTQHGISPHKKEFDICYFVLTLAIHLKYYRTIKKKF